MDSRLEFFTLGSSIRTLKRQDHYWVITTATRFLTSADVLCSSNTNLQHFILSLLLPSSSVLFHFFKHYPSTLISGLILIEWSECNLTTLYELQVQCFLLSFRDLFQHLLTKLLDSMRLTCCFISLHLVNHSSMCWILHICIFFCTVLYALQTARYRAPSCVPP